MVLYDYAVRIVVSIAISYALVFILSFLIEKLKNTSIRVFNPAEYFPEEQITSLKQVYYLLLIFIILFSITNFFFDNGIGRTTSPEFYALNAILDIIVSVYLASFIIRNLSLKTHILVFLLLPVASFSYLLFGPSYVELWDIIRVPALLYLVMLLYRKFREFRDEHSLGLSVLLLFSIIFFSVISTIVLENRHPLDAVVMVSNAFTSNGYAILGSTPGGKLNSIILVWSGYIISGAATATLTAAILLRHNNRKLEKYDEKLDKIQSSLDELKEKQNKEK